MKHNAFAAGLLCLALLAAACKNDKKAGEAAADSSDLTTSTQPEAPVYRDAEAAEFVGEFADANYPDKGFWKKVTVKAVAGNKMEVVFSSAKDPITGMGCNFKGLGDHRNGYVQVPLNPESTDPTFVTLRFMPTGELIVGAEGGGSENPTDALQLFCMTSPSNTLGGVYEKVK